MAAASTKEARRPGEPPLMTEFEMAMGRLATLIDRMTAGYISPTPQDFRQLQKLPITDTLRQFFERHEGFAAEGNRRLDAEERQTLISLERAALRHKRNGEPASE